MSKLVLYDNKLLFDKEIRCKLSHEIGRGSEGICYEYDDFAYKVLFDKGIISCMSGILDYMEDPSIILTTDDINLPSFAFPEELYVVKNWLLGYKSRLIKGNLFSEKVFNSIDDLKKINFNDLAKAYKIMLQDVDLLSEEKIRIYDLSFNLAFDGKRLIGFDTCGYKKADYNIKKDNRNSVSFNSAFDRKKSTGIDNCDCENADYNIKKANRKSLALSIEEPFYMMSDYEIDYSIKNDDIDSYLEDVDKYLRLKK